MLSFNYRKTNYYLLPALDGESLVAFDAGYPCSRNEYARAMKASGYRFERIRWAMVSHFHLDHAGLVRDFQDAGIRCLLFENQGDGIASMESIIRRRYPEYRPILPDGFLRLETAGSRAFLASLGIAGEVIPTPGHSDDSVTLVTDAREALIGDLCPFSQLMDDDEKSLRSWARIQELGGERVFPSHANPFEL